MLAVQDDLVGFRVGVPLEGDITIALWFGAVVRDTDPPALAYAFHTAFVAPGVMRIEARDLTVSTSAALDRGELRGSSARRQ